MIESDDLLDAWVAKQQEEHTKKINANAKGFKQSAFQHDEVISFDEDDYYEEFEEEYDEEEYEEDEE